MIFFSATNVKKPPKHSCVSGDFWSG